jgi:hypothetical protein
MRSVLILLLCLGAAAVRAEAHGETPGEEAPAQVGGTMSGVAWRVGGSFMLSYGGLLAEPRNQGTMQDEGFVGEFALFARVNVRDTGLSASVRTCWGCHGLALEEAAVEYRPNDWLSLKGGRLNLPVGAFNQRHDYNLRRTVSKPLTRAMGNMVRGLNFNQGVLPAPYSDNGVQAGLDINLGPLRMLTDLFVVGGLKGNGPDVSLMASREFRDNNGEPAAGGRLALETAQGGLGAIYNVGNYDGDRRRNYQIFGVDARVRAGPLTLEGEFLTRRTEYTNAGGREDHWLKFGWYALADWRVAEGLHVAAMADSLHVTGLPLGPAGPTLLPALAITDDNNRIVRVVAGAGFSPLAGLVARLNVEFWEFTDFDDVWVIQAGLGWVF